MQAVKRMAARIKEKLGKKRKNAAMTHGTDCTAAIVTRVVWVRGEGAVDWWWVTL